MSIPTGATVVLPPEELNDFLNPLSPRLLVEPVFQDAAHSAFPPLAQPLYVYCQHNLLVLPPCYDRTIHILPSIIK